MHMHGSHSTEVAKNINHGTEDSRIRLSLRQTTHIVMQIISYNYIHCPERCIGYDVARSGTIQYNSDIFIHLGNAYRVDLTSCKKWISSKLFSLPSVLEF